MRQLRKKSCQTKQTWVRCDPVASLDRSRTLRKNVTNGGDTVQLRHWSVPFRRSYHFLRVCRLHRRTLRGRCRWRWVISRGWEVARRRRFHHLRLLLLRGDLFRRFDSVPGRTQDGSWLDNHWFNRRTKLSECRHLWGNVRVQWEREKLRIDDKEWDGIRERERGGTEYEVFKNRTVTREKDFKEVGCNETGNSRWVFWLRVGSFYRVASERDTEKMVKGVRITFFFCVINELIKFAALCHLELKKNRVVGVNCRLFRE